MSLLIRKAALRESCKCKTTRNSAIQHDPCSANGSSSVSHQPPVPHPPVTQAPNLMLRFTHKEEYACLHLCMCGRHTVSAVTEWHIRLENVLPSDNVPSTPMFLPQTTLLVLLLFSHYVFFSLTIVLRISALRCLDVIFSYAPSIQLYLIAFCFYLSCKLSI